MRSVSKSLEVMVIDDERSILNLYEEIIHRLGHIPVSFDNGNEALNYLKGFDKENQIFNHQKCAAILCDWMMKNMYGDVVLREKNKIDAEIPFFLISGIAQDKTKEYMIQNHLDGYLNKPTYLKDISALLSLVLFDRFPIRKGGIFVKMGGSAEDAEAYYDEPLRMEVLQYLARKSEEGKAVFLNTGGGRKGDELKRFSSLYGDLRDENGRPLCPMVKIATGEALKTELHYNCVCLASLVNKYDNDKAIIIDPGQLTGREPIPWFDEMTTWNSVSLEKIFNQDKMVFMSSAPRHMGIIPYMVGGRRRYHIVDRMDSDSQSIIMAAAMGTHPIFVKRTDGAYSFDPFKGFCEERPVEDDWKSAQSANKRLDGLSFREVYEGVTSEGVPFSTIGSFDGKPGHLIEKGAAFTAMLLGTERLDIIPIKPQEFYMGGVHIITGERLCWDDGRKRREHLFDMSLDGRCPSGIGSR